MHACQISPADIAPLATESTHPGLCLMELENYIFYKHKLNIVRALGGDF